MIQKSLQKFAAAWKRFKRSMIFTFFLVVAGIFFVDFITDILRRTLFVYFSLHLTGGSWLIFRVVYLVLDSLTAIWILKHRVDSLRVIPKADSFFTDPQSATITFRAVVHRIVDSEEFATALRPVLPKGDDDKKFGFDYIPFLLRNIDERRIRFYKSSRLFLTGTITLAIVFSVILGTFGVIVVDESATGDAFRLKEINQGIAKIREQIPFVTRNLSDNPAYQELMKQDVEVIVDHSPNDDVEKKIQEHIRTDIDTSNLGHLKVSLAGWKNDPTIKDQNLVRSLSALDTSLNRFEDRRDEAGYFVEQSITSLNPTIQSATAKTAENRTPELLKRIALGLIISSFFFAILKYMAGLYRDHHNQMVQAEQDDLAIRRFYVAFRCAGDDSGQRVQVLTEFLAGAERNGKQDTRSDGDFNPQTQELLKDVLTAIAKRAGA